MAIFRLSVFILSITSLSLTAYGSNVSTCQSDATMSQVISEELSTAEKTEVYNVDGEMVGAFQYNPDDGELMALYLCGSNPGYYYAVGNLDEAMVSAIYNDEYEAVVSSNIMGDKVMKITIEQMSFLGESADADYESFSTTLFVNLK